VGQAADLTSSAIIITDRRGCGTPVLGNLSSHGTVQQLKHPAGVSECSAIPNK
jgi:hypothetical protein